MKIGFISDIHEDIVSLEKALHLLGENKCDAVICLGDIVGFTIPFYRYIETRNADECIRLVKENCTEVVAGNHDLYAVKKIPLYNAGFDYGENWYNLDYDKRAKRARNKIWLYEDNEISCRLCDASVEYLTSLPELKIAEIDNSKFLISHFCFPDFSGSSIYFPGEAFHLKKHFEVMHEQNCMFSFSGHGHPEGVIIVDNDKISLHNFGTHKLNDNNYWIVAPCTARTTRQNGVLVFDSINYQLEAIAIK